MLFAAVALLLQAAPLPRRHLVEDLRITTPGPANDFVAISAVVERPGAIYLADYRGPAIYRFDAAGTFVRQVGRTGDGPGEYRMPIAIGLHNDSLWVYDPMQHRVTLFGPEDRPGRSITPVTGGWGTANLGGDGSVVTFPLWSSARPKNSAAPIVRYGPDGTVRDTLFTIPISTSSMEIDLGGGGRILGVQPFTDDPIVAGSPVGDGFLKVERATEGPAVIGLTRYDATGRVRWRRSMVYTPSPLDPSVIDSVVDQWAHPRERGASAIPADRVRDALWIPRRALPVQAAAIAADGSIWLRRPTPVGRPALYTVLDADGTPRFEVELPPKSRFAGLTGSSLWLSLLDEDDVPVAVRYRVERE